MLLWVVLIVIIAFVIKTYNALVKLRNSYNSNGGTYHCTVNGNDNCTVNVSVSELYIRVTDNNEDNFINDIIFDLKEEIQNKKNENDKSILKNIQVRNCMTCPVIGLTKVLN